MIESCSLTKISKVFEVTNKVKKVARFEAVHGIEIRPSYRFAPGDK